MNTAVVYLDKVFIGNLLMNGLLLWAAGRFTQIKIKNYRIILGAGLGSLYALAFFLPGAELFYTFYMKIVVSLIMVAVAFAPVPPRRFIQCLCFFYLVSFTAGGVVIGFSYLANETGGVGPIQNFVAIVNKYLWSGLLLTLALLWASVAVLPRFFQGRQRIEAVKMLITIYFEGKGVTVRGLVDTGNSLCDPISGEPVVVVEHDAIKEVLPGPMQEQEACDGDAICVIEKMMETPWSVRLRLIPFQSLGNDRGILLGIKPDRIEFVKDSRVQRVDQVIIGIHNRNLDSARDYHAIINPSLLDRAISA